jgi:hypothetical protein
VNLDAKRRKQIRILYDASVLKKMVLCFGAIYDCAAIGEGIHEKEEKKVLSSSVLVLILLSFIAEFFEENFESKENDTQFLKNVNRHIFLCKQLNKTTFSLWLLSIRI